MRKIADIDVVRELNLIGNNTNEVLDKIRIEIERLPITDTAIRLVDEILDKYKLEIEPQDMTKNISAESKLQKIVRPYLFERT